jgi:apolipoprotein N-acyltransferase
MALLSQAIQGFTGATPYVRYGNYPVIVLAFAMLAGAGIMSRRRD